MKRALYTLADEEFITLLERASFEFNMAKLPFMLVGGIATQAHIADYVCRKHNLPLLSLAELNDFRIQDYLRATDDIDATLDPRKVGEPTNVARIVLNVLDRIVGEGLHMSPTGDHLIGIAMHRKGVRRPIFRLGLDEDPHDPEKTASFNLYQGPQDTNASWPADIRDFEGRYYFDFMDRAKEIEIPYNDNRRIKLRVKRAEDLLATKIIRGRGKDLQDALSLSKYAEICGVPIDYKIVEQLLCSPDPKYEVPNKSFVEKFETFQGLKEKFSA